MAIEVLLWCIAALLATALPAVVHARRATTSMVVYALALAASTIALGAAAAALLTYVEVPQTSELPIGLPWLGAHFRLDPLAAAFLVVVNLGGAMASLHGLGDGRHEREPGRVLPFFPAYLAGMNLVVLADDAFTFLLTWEFMSLASWALVMAHHRQGGNAKAGYIYLLMASFGTLSLLLAFGLLAGPSGDYGFDAIRNAVPSSGRSTAVLLLALLGAGSKAGLVPLHVWLPLAHPAAPSHVSALMSGVMTKVAVYGFVRIVFDLLGPPVWWWGAVVLTAGGITAVLGVLYALMQHDLKRLLAYHSVENLGIIFIGLGLALLFLATGHGLLGALALVAALYHTVNHALFKGLLFLGAGAILHSTHERDLEQMGGLLRRMPWTGLFFLIGCLSISALPPFNGFVSEWLTFQAALQAWQLDSGVLRSLIPIASAVLALTGALAAACFVKVYGVAFLGQARSRHVRRARPVPLGMRAGQGVLAVLCVVLGILPTGVLGLIDSVPRQLLGNGLPQATEHGWLWLTPVPAESVSYSAPLVVFLLAVTVGMAIWGLRHGAVRRVRRCPAWDCGFAPPTPRMQYTATAFAQPIRRVFGLLFHIDESVEQRDHDAARYHLAVRDRAWGLLYAPLAQAVESAARRVVRLQSGNIRVYLGWTLSTLLVLLWIIS